MKHNLQFDFLVDKENKTIHVKREFAAPVDLVWAAWTKPEILDQWWAPKPWKAETKTMDFSVGGSWLYAMVGPEGEKQFCKVEYMAITENKNFVANDAFCDPEGTINTDFPQNQWDTNFIKKENNTLVDVTLSFETLDDLETIIKMGFKEGFSAALDNLEELLENKQS